MRAEVLIVGQGLAGTLLAWEFERAGISFAIADAGHADAASRVAAGIVNPITGRRLVKSWRIDELLPLARKNYREIEAALGVSLWREMRVRRLFADDRERRIATEKQARGELAPYVMAEADDEGCWIEGAARVDLPLLLSATRERWQKQDRPRITAADVMAEIENYSLVIDCTGAAGARQPAFAFIPWEFSKGEMLVVSSEALAPDVILNRGHWALPVAPGAAWVGATHEPNFSNLRPTAAGRAALEASAAILLGRPFAVADHWSGVRVNLPDKRPVAGRHPSQPRVGILNGLGAKGALWAPALARQWVNHLTEGVPFDAEIDAVRFLSSKVESR